LYVESQKMHNIKNIVSDDKKYVAVEGGVFFKLLGSAPKQGKTVGILTNDKNYPTDHLCFISIEGSKYVIDSQLRCHDELSVPSVLSVINAAMKNHGIIDRPMTSIEFI